jgi:hypothetical protein
MFTETEVEIHEDYFSSVRSVQCRIAALNSLCALALLGKSRGRLKDNLRGFRVV